MMHNSLPATIKFLALDPRAVLPTRGSAHSAGLDLYAIEEVIFSPGARAGVRTGLAVAIPAGYYGRVAPRSGLARDCGLDTLAGVIDSDYRGELICLLINHGAAQVKIEPRQRIAQLIIEAIVTPEPEWEEQLNATSRGAGGFGSTGD
ncbi:MAG TPA: dUTP diphosphatase [Pyrinomonadaceae bacterium]|jgi:dUTP pyrophosphatase|nr:dUTP diphosphatase [Pyrinomonadaceae bacterium]